MTERIFSYVNQGIAIVASIVQFFGGGSSTKKVIHVQDPALVEMLRSMESFRSEFLSSMNAMEAHHKAFNLDPLRRETADAAAELQEQRARKDRAETEAREAFNSIIETAMAVVSEATKPVDVLLGAQGSGKSTVANLLYGISEAIPGQGFSHVTTQNKVHRRGDAQRPLVDTVGRMPDVKGVIRVLACIICSGMNPEGLIIVHNERVGSLNDRFMLLGANEVNYLSFEPRSYWLYQKRAAAADGAVLADHIFIDPSREVSYLNQIVGASSLIRPSDLRARLLHAFATLDYNLFKNATGDQGAVLGIIFYFAKTLTERRDYHGSDLNFIDRI